MEDQPVELESRTAMGPDGLEVWQNKSNRTVLTVNRQASLPDWFKSYRSHQSAAIEKIVDAFSRVDLVIVDAPTGAGKTLIAESVRQRLNADGLYVCSTKTLQAQFINDYPYGKLIQGRANYQTEKGSRDWFTCADCQWVRDTHETCDHCFSKDSCPYEVAKKRARHAPLAVLNMAYYLAALNNPGRYGLGDRNLGIIDEADELEGEIMRHVTLVVGKKVRKVFDLPEPPKITVPASWDEWLCKSWVKVQVFTPSSDEEIKMRDDLLSRISFIRGHLDKVVYTGDKDTVEFKPVTVDWLGRGLFWAHCKKFLLMSATVINPDEMMGSLGWVRNYEVVRLDSTFDVARRPIRVLPHADMSRKVNQIDELLSSIGRVLAIHPSERILIHSVSYELCGLIRSGIKGRPVFSYGQASDRASAISQYCATDNAVLVAPSLERGVDFAGDLCRVIVVAKVPFPYLGDKQVSTRLYSTRTGQEWYATKCVRSIVQMTGRGMRGEGDSCVTYILDSQFVRLWNQNRKLFPKWWAEALDWRFVLL